jgi:hypothetical protein
MAKDNYSYSIHSIKLTRSDSLRVTANIAVFAIVYTFAGAILSYILWYAFDPYDPDSENEVDKLWESKGMLFQFYDILVELALIAITAFWLTYYLDTAAPIIPIRKGLEDFIDSYTSGMFFMFAIFIFLNDLSSKLKYIFNTLLGDFFDYWVPEEGSILDLTLKYSDRQKKLDAGGKGEQRGEQRKNSASMFQHST